MHFLCTQPDRSPSSKYTCTKKCIAFQGSAFVLSSRIARIALWAHLSSWSFAAFRVPAESRIKMFPLFGYFFLTKQWDHCYHVVHLSRLCIPFRSFPFLHLSKEGNAGTLPPSGEFLLRARNNCSFGHLGWSSFWRKGKKAGGTDLLDISSSYLFFTLKFEVTLFKNV